MKFKWKFLLALAFFAPAIATAQVGTSTDIIIGQVIGPDSLPIAGARVEAISDETGTKRTKTTNSEGRYTIVFPDGGGNYRVTVIAIGYAPHRVNLTRQADEDRLVGDVQLGRATTVLSAVQVRARQDRGGQFQRPEAGSTERNLPPMVLNRLPIDQSDLNNLATLMPGVVGTAATDTTRASFSVAGQPANQNQITLDGLSFGSGSVPQEAVRNTRVVTSTYDVSRGQFTGGQVASTTRGGTNTFQGSVNVSRRDPELEFSDINGGFSPKYTLTQISLGAGGPIIKDKFFSFGALQFNRRIDPLQSLLVADPLSLQRLGTNPDSVNRFLGILNQYGLTPTQTFIPDEKIGDNASALVRFDYRLGESNTLMLRGDWRGNIQDASRIGALSVPHSGGNAHNSGGGGMFTITSNWDKYINELRAYESIDKRTSAPYLSVPAGRVVVSSILSDGATGVSTLQFGGNSGLPQNASTRLLETSDELSRLTTSGGHRVKLGGLLNEERTFSGVIPNQFGTFTFNSLADFSAQRPASFTRTLFAQDRQARTINGAVYLGDAWRRSPELQLTYGLRMETSSYADAPAYNPQVEQLFGRRTDRFPSEIHVSPRIGFTYLVRAEEGPPLVTLRGGVGEFRGKAPSQLFSLATDATGLTTGQSQIFCVGGSVPTPDWSSYLNNPQTIPAACNGASTVFANQRRNVTVFNPDFAAPRAWRGSFGLTKRLFDRYNASIDASYARGVALSGSTDLNLDTIPKFHLTNEANRPVFTPAQAIVPASGATAIAGSRVHPEFGTVSEIMSRLNSDTKQLTLTFGGMTTRGGIMLNTSYTFTRSRDQAQGLAQGFGIGGGGAAFGGAGVTTAGNPNMPGWGTSDVERRHTFLATITWPVKPAFDITAIGRLTSGGYFTPTVSGDVNGDGARNDRAFIFDPGKTRPDILTPFDVYSGMDRLLRSTTGRTHDCLTSQLGQIAARNSCAAPWGPSLDMQSNIRPTAFGLNRKVTFSLIALNTLSGLDQLLHGRDNLHGWGQPVFPDRTLLYVRGFDPQTQQFKYEVNEHFGAANGTRNAFRVPFQIALQARVTLGQDPAQQQMRNALGAGGGDARTTAERLKERMQRTIPNPFLQILEREDSLPAGDTARLNLTVDQRKLLRQKGDSLKVKADSLVDALAETMANEKNPDPMTMFAKMRPRIEQARNISRDANKVAQSVLTPEQWKKVPASIKNPFQQRGEGGGFDFGRQ